MSVDLELKNLENFYGTEKWYNLGKLYNNIKATDGVKYIIDNGYHWFVSDAIISINMKPELKNQEFLNIKLKVIKDKDNNKAETIITDGNNNILYTQKYGYTSAKKDLNLFLTDGIILLDSEY